MRHLMEKNAGPQAHGGATAGSFAFLAGPPASFPTQGRRRLR